MANAFHRSDFERSRVYSNIVGPKTDTLTAKSFGQIGFTRRDVKESRKAKNEGGNGVAEQF